MKLSFDSIAHLHSDAAGDQCRFCMGYYCDRLEKYNLAHQASSFKTMENHYYRQQKGFEKSEVVFLKKKPVMQ